jgi:hypothetical protein
VIPILLLVVFTAVPVAAQEIQTYRQAVTWLETNPGSPQFGSVLLEAVHLAPSLDDLRSVTSNHLASVSDSRQRARILFTVGRVQELAYRYSDARISYSRALESDPFLWDAAIRRGALALEAGDVSEAIILLSRVVNQAPTRSLQRQAAILRSRAFFLSGEVRRASLHLRGLTGYDAASASGSGTVVGEVTSQIEEEALLLLWEVASLMEDEPVRDWSAAALSARGSGVPEAVLLGSSGDDRTEFFPSPSQVLGGVSYTGYRRWKNVRPGSAPKPPMLRRAILPGRQEQREHRAPPMRSPHQRTAHPPSRVSRRGASGIPKMHPTWPTTFARWDSPPRSGRPNRTDQRSTRSSCRSRRILPRLTHRKRWFA